MVKIDVSQVVRAMVKSLPKSGDKKAIVKQLAAVAMYQWKRLAQETLRSSAREYVAGLQQVLEGTKAKIILGGLIPNMIENGWPGGDMRQWLLQGPNVKQGKNGPYNTVPFRHGAPGTSGKNVGPQMPMDIHRGAKLLAPTRTGLSGPGTIYGERLGPDSRGLTHKGRDILLTKERLRHATSIYSGMIRQEKEYAKATQSQYTTFRRISKVSRGPKHWFHPGIKPRRFAVQVQAHIAEVAKGIVVAMTEEE